MAAETDIELRSCSEPREAVAVADRVRPDVILLDLVMPGVEGLTLLQALRTQASTAATPVIALSGTDDSDLRTRALAAGAVDYLVKLPAREDLLACLRRHAGLPPPLPSLPPALPPSLPQGEELTLDQTVIAAFRQADTPGSSSFVRMLIDQFLDEAGSHVSRLGEAAQQADAAALKSLAHGLKGSARTMGANRLASLCGHWSGMPRG